MRYFFLLAISIALLFAQQQETTIISLEKQRYVAMTKNDQQFLHKILGDDLTFIHANGAVESKALFLQRLKSKDLIYHSIEVKDLNVKMYANCAVVMGVSNIEAQGGKQKVSLNLRFTTVYVRNKEKEWKVVAYQSTRIMQMDRKS